MSAIKQQMQLAEYYADMCNQVFSKEVINPHERVEIETLCAIAVELIKSASPYKLREAARNVEIRYWVKNGEIEK